jgi:ABC-type sugar transport system substrate-binding protein
MRHVHKVAAVLVALVLPAFTGACGNDDNSGSTNPQTLKIGFITKFPVDFYDTMVDAVKAYDKDHGDVEVIFGQGKSGTDDEGVIAHIENMIVQQVKAIAITPTSPNVQGALDKAVKAGIKIVLVDNDIPGWTGKSSVVATDNLAGGKLAGQWLAAKLQPGATVGILQGRLGNPSLDDRVKGLKQTLGDKAKIVAEPATDCDQTKGLNAAQDMLTANPNITAIYGACGPPITGALQALKSAGKKPGQVIVVGFDASPDEVAAIIAGDQAASVAQFPAKMGSMGIEAAVAAARGQSVAANIDTGTEMVTKDNAAKFK